MESALYGVYALAVFCIRKLVGKSVQSTVHGLICLFYTYWDFLPQPDYHPSFGRTNIKLSSSFYSVCECLHLSNLQRPGVNIFCTECLPCHQLIQLPCSFNSRLLQASRNFLAWLEKRFVVNNAYGIFTFFKTYISCLFKTYISCLFLLSEEPTITSRLVFAFVFVFCCS